MIWNILLVATLIVSLSFALGYFIAIGITLHWARNYDKPWLFIGTDGIMFGVCILVAALAAFALWC